MIEVKNLQKSFGDHRVLDGVNLAVATGESVVIIGRSGGGKSVLLKLMVGLLQSDAGTVLIDGEDIGPMDERQLLRVREKFGMLFQGAALFDSMTVEENVAFALHRQRKWSHQEISDKVARALEMVELTGIQKKMPSELSGGMRKRVGLARAIIYEPRVVFYDEPTTGLDPIVADSIDRLIIRIASQLHVTTIAVTHDMRSAGRIGQRILLLHEGRIHAEGTPKEIFESPDPIVHRFVNGISESNELTLK